MTGPKPLAKQPALLFVNGNGKPTVLNIVPQLRKGGLRHFYGLLDLDDGQPVFRDGISVIARRSLENYLLDPINVWYHLHNTEQAPGLPGISIARGQRDQIRRLAREQLQQMADVVLAAVENKLPPTIAARNNRKDAAFTNGVTFSYPTWFFETRKDELFSAYQEAFGPVQPNRHAPLITSFASLNFVPQDLAALLEGIQSGL